MDRGEVKQAFSILNDMMKSFGEWFPYDETYTDRDKQDAKNAFARTKLNLELGEYTRDDYEYLFWLINKCVEDEQFYWAIGVFIEALSEEYGWI